MSYLEQRAELFTKGHHVSASRQAMKFIYYNRQANKNYKGTISVRLIKFGHLISYVTFDTTTFSALIGTCISNGINRLAIWFAFCQEFTPRCICFTVVVNSSAKIYICNMKNLITEVSYDKRDSLVWSGIDKTKNTYAVYFQCFHSTTSKQVGSNQKSSA